MTLKRLAGAMMFVAAFILPLVLMPLLPDSAISAAAFSYGMQGPVFAMGFPLMALMIQGMRWWNGE